ncbi:hypothetical protein ABBQ38_000181 [Trebouxia sp. C0009 RCD-2024]
MQLNLGSTKDNLWPRVGHQCCSQPLRCRAFRATPSTASQRSRSKSSSRNLAAHARFAKYTGDTGSSGQPASGTSGLSGSNTDSSSKSASKAPSQSATPPPPRFAKYTSGAASSGPSNSKSDASSKSANKAVSQGKPSSQSTSSPPQRFAKYTGDAPKSGSGSSGSKTGATSKSPKFDDKQVQVQVYKPSGETSTEVRKVKVPAKDQSRRSKDTESRADADKAVDDANDAVQDGVDQAEDAAQEGLDQLAEGISDAADQAQENADQFERDAQGVVDDIEEVFDDAADQAAEQLNNAADQVQSAAQGAADIAANFANSLQKGAQSGSPYQTQPLSTLEQNPYEGKPGRKPSAEVQTSYFKLRLMECIAGLDRGFAANSFAAMQVESAALALTEQSQPVQLSWTAASDQKDKDKEDKPSGLAQLSGTWRLVYSSAFSSGSIGGRKPGPPASLLPARLGQVYQVISPYSSRLDNVLELYTGLPGIEPVVLTATLKHHFEAVGGNIVQITFEDTEIKVTGGIGGLLGNLPEIMVPQLPEPFKPSRQQRTSSFDVLFLDSDVRVTRGSRGELRIFVKT